MRRIGQHWSGWPTSRSSPGPNPTMAAGSQPPGRGPNGGHPVAGRLRQTRTAARFDGTPAEHRFGAPTLGQHTDEILREAGLGDSDIASLREVGVVGG